MTHGEARPEVDIALVIPTHDRQALLARTLDAVGALDPAPSQVIVVADRCHDGSADLVRERGYTLLETDAGGPAAARNAGWRHAATPVVAFTDDDCRPDTGWLGALSHPFADPSVGLAQGRVEPDGDVGPNDRTLSVGSEYGLYEAANVAYRRAALEEVGGFDESFLPYRGRPFGEDTDLAWRVRRAGWSSRFVPEAVVRHHVFPGTLWPRLGEEWIKRAFPSLFREVPELRTVFSRSRWLLRPQSGVAQLFVAGSVLLPARRTRPLGVLLLLPYLRWLKDQELGPRDAAGQGVKDVIGSAALIIGSVRARSVLL